MKTKADPTGQIRNRKRAVRSLVSRLSNAEKQIKSLFRDIPRVRHTKASIKPNTVIYEYDLPPNDLEQFSASVVFILNDELLETQLQELPFGWYFEDDIERPYREGTLEETNVFNQLVAGAIIAGVLVKGFPPRKLDPMAVIASEQYRNALANQYVSNFNNIKTLSSRTASQVMHQINSGIQSGLTPTAIAGEISERFNVSRSGAERIARTEVNKAYNDAKMNANDIAAEQTGLRSGVIHISALTATTRQHHADRHGNSYTTADQRIWWDSGSNRINCLCSTQTVLVDHNGNVVNTEQQATLKAEGVKFFSKLDN